MMSGEQQKNVLYSLLIILLVALLVRLVVALMLGDEAAPLSGAADQYSYDVLAQRVLAGNGFSFPSDWYPFTKANEPTAHWSFLYTLYLSTIYALFGHHPLAARVIQVLLSALNILLAYRLGRRLFGEASGLAAAALTAVYAYLIFFNAALMTQAFYILAVLAALDQTLALASKPSWRGWMVLGLVLGLGVLLRQTLLLFMPVLFAWLVWTRLRNGNAEIRKRFGILSISWISRSRVPITGIVFSLVFIALLIVPWTWRNYVVYHDFLLLNSNGGFWLYSSNHPLQGTNFDPNFAAPIPANLASLSEPALDRALYQQAIGFILSDPRRFLLLSLNRIKDYFWLFPSEDSTLISNLSRLFSFGVYLPFMLYGLYLSKGRWRLCVPLYLYIAFDAVLCLISWSAPRYRLPSDAVLMPFAGLALSQLAARVWGMPVARSLMVAQVERLRNVAFPLAKRATEIHSDKGS